MWVTNGLRAGIVMLLAVTDPTAQPRHAGMTAFIVEKEPGVTEQPGLTIPPPLKKLGYKGVESTELVFDGFRIPATSILGGEGQVGVGFKQFMAGIELGRVNVAARGLGIAESALENAVRYAREREAFGKPIANHQLIQAKIAMMATKIRAAELLMIDAARRRTPASGPTWRPAWRSCSRPRSPRRPRSRRCGSTAATATRRSIRSSGCTATRLY